MRTFVAFRTSFNGTGSYLTNWESGPQGLSVHTMNMQKMALQNKTTGWALSKAKLQK